MLVEPHAAGHAVHDDAERPRRQARLPDVRLSNCLVTSEDGKGQADANGRRCCDAGGDPPPLWGRVGRGHFNKLRAIWRVPPPSASRDLLPQGRSRPSSTGYGGRCCGAVNASPQYFPTLSPCRCCARPAERGRHQLGDLLAPCRTPDARSTGASGPRCAASRSRRCVARAERGFLVERATDVHGGAGDLLLLERALSAASSTRLPRDTLTKKADGFMRANFRRSSGSRSRSLATTRQTTKSDSASSVVERHLAHAAGPVLVGIGDQHLHAEREARSARDERAIAP